jgi:hypothetical protein
MVNLPTAEVRTAGESNHPIGDQMRWLLDR